MFLKSLKNKSNQKFIEKRLKERILSGVEGKITSVGVILNAEEFCDYDEVDEFLSSLKISSIKQKIVTFCNDDNDISGLRNPFTTKDFGWRGKLKNSELKDFTNTNFDVLICYFLGKNIELSQIAADTKANFKVGISKHDQRIFDLIIDLNSNNFELFKSELKKYLSILNKL